MKISKEGAPDQNAELPKRSSESQRGILTGRQNRLEAMLPKRVAATGRIIDLAVEIYGAGTAVTGRIPGSAQLTRLIQEIPHMPAVTHASGLPPREMTAGILMVLGGDSTRKVVTNTISRLRTRSNLKKA